MFRPLVFERERRREGVRGEWRGKMKKNEKKSFFMLDGSWGCGTLPNLPDGAGVSSVRRSHLGESWNAAAGVCFSDTCKLFDK